MADTAIAITAGSGTNVDTRTEATNGNHRQVVVLGDPSLNAGVAAVDATNGLSVNVTNASLTVASHAVTNAGTFATQVSSTVPGTGATNLGKAIDSAAGSTDTGVTALVVRDDALTTLTPVDGDYTVLRTTAKGALHAEISSDGTAVVFNANGQATMTNSAPVTIASNQSAVAVKNGGSEYEKVAASATAQVLGATGGTGDYIAGILVTPETTTPGVITLLDNAVSIPIFVGGASSVSNLVPFYVPLGLISVSGAWKITTGANVSAVGIGDFT